MLILEVMNEQQVHYVHKTMVKFWDCHI